MVKKTGKASSKRSVTKKAPPKAATPKMTAEKLSDDQRAVLLFHYKKKIEPALLTAKNAQAQVQHLFEMAKKEGITKKEITLAISLDTPEGEQAAKSEVERIMRVARWCGAKLGMQFDLFPKAATRDVDPIFEEGRATAMRDEPCRPPQHHGQKAAQRWMEGHAAGREALSRMHAEGIKGFQPLSDAMTSVIDKAGIGASLEEPPPGPALHETETQEPLHH